MSNKGIGNLFEQELDKLLYEHDFWVHRLTQNANGQPADIIAVKDDQADLIDCKVCTHDTFDLARVEENQQLAMTHWNNCGNDNAWFALKTSFGVYMLSWEAVRNAMKTSVKLSFEAETEDGTREYYWDLDPPKITKHGAYFVTVSIPDNIGTEYNYPWELKISGYKVSLVEQKVTKHLNLKGKVVTWENPLISNYTQADELADWIKDYYTSGAEYEYTTRGNPELDATDILYQENDYHKDMKVVISKHTVEFGTGLSGQITARRKGD